MIKDPIVEEVRRIRRLIQEEAGGAEGVFARYAEKGSRRESKSRRTSPRLTKRAVLHVTHNP